MDRRSANPFGQPGHALYRDIAHLTFLAFSLESFLNHIGQQTIPWWEDAERSLKPEAKLRVICERIKLSIDPGVRPFQSLSLLNRFRNEMAHGKTEISEITEADFFAKGGPAATWWQKARRTINRAQLQEDVEELANRVWKHLGYDTSEHPNPFGLMQTSLGRGH